MSFSAGLLKAEGTGRVAERKNCTGLTVRNGAIAIGMRLYTGPATR
jgi:hypothetical protein